MLTQSPLSTPAARRAHARILQLARSGPADPDFLLELAEQFRLLVPNVASFWSGSDPLTTLATAPARVENMPGQCERFWDREFHDPDFILFRDLARAPVPTASLYEATDGRPTRSVRYRELNDALGYGDELRTVFRSGTAVWGMAALWREEGQPPFSAAERKLVADLSAPIAESFRRAALQNLGAPASAPEAPGLLVFDEDGVLESLNDQAEAWLRELPLTRIDAAGVFPVSTGIQGVVALTRAIAAGVETGVARTHVQSCRGRWLVIEGSPLRGRQGVPKTAVVIQPAKAAEVAPIIVEAYDLGAREQEITQMIARGLSTTQIAQGLYLSPHTVRDYVKSIFAKVGVSSRGELVARLFAEHYAEPLRDAVLHAPGGVS